MGEASPIRNVATEEVGKAADAVVGKAIGDENRDLGIAGQLADSHGRGDPGVASADDHDSHAPLRRGR
jgi:hypothetical protein